MRTLLLAVLLAGGCRTPSSAADAPSCGAPGKQPRLTRKLGAHGRLVLGVVADANGAPPGTLEHLADKFRGQPPDAMVALGNLGTSSDEIARALTILGKVGVPVLALAGDGESARTFSEAVAQARTGGVDVINLVEVRLLDTGDIDLISAPGSPSASAPCHYSAADLTALRELASRRPTVLLSYTPPRLNGPDAVDWNQGANTGDPAMLDLINALYPNAALFGHAEDAGGRITRAWINVGAVTRGMGIRFQLERGLPRYEVIRCPSL